MKRLILISALTLPTIVLAQSQEEEDKSYLAGLIEDNLSGDARDVNIIGFAGALSSEATIERLTVADSEGIWLTLEDVTLDWNRSALLRGAIDVEELSAAKITVARAPLPDTSVDLPAAEATPFALPELPVSIALDTLRIDEIALGDVFLGEPVTISLTGTAQLSGGEGSANVQAIRLDARAGQFDINGSYSNTSQELALMLSLVEDPDGIIARLLDLPGKPAVALTLEGDAPLSDYEATLNIATNGEERLAGDLRLTQTDAGQQFNLAVGGDVSPLFAPEYQTFFGPDIQLDATGIANAEGGFALSNLDLSAQNIALSGEVRTDADGWPEKIALRGSIASRGGERVLLPLTGPQTLVQSVDLNVAYDREQSDDWSAIFDITDLERPGLGIDAIELNGGGTLLAGDRPALTANFNYGATGLTLDDVGLAEALGQAISGEMTLAYQSGTPTQIERLTLDGPGIELLANATILGPDQGLRTESTVVLSVDALDRFSTLAGQDLGGGAELNIISTISPLDGFFEILMNGETINLQIGIDQVDPVIAGDGTLSMLAERDTAGTRLRSLRIAADGGIVTATADIRSDATDAEFDVSLVDVGLVVDGIDGPAQVSGTANQTPGAPLRFDIDATAPDVALNARGTLTDNSQVDADITLDASDLATYRPLIQQDLAGIVDIDVAVNAVTDGSFFDVTLTGQTQDLRSGIEQLDPLLRGAGTIDINAARTGADTFALRNLRIATDAIEITGGGAGDPNGPLNALLNVALADLGSIAPGLSGPLNAEVTAVRDAAGSSDIDLKANGPGTDVNADVTIAPDMMISGDVQARVANLAPFQRLIGQPVSGGVSATISGALQPDLSIFDAELSVRTDDLAIANATVDPLLRGIGTIDVNAVRTGPNDFALNQLRIVTDEIEISGNAAGDPTGPVQATLDVALANLGRIAPGLTGPLDAQITAVRDAAGSSDIDLTATGPGTNISADVTVAPDLTIAGNARANVGDLAPFQRLIGQPVRGGVDAVVVGTLKPDLSAFNTEVTLRTQDIGIGNPSVDVMLRGAGTLGANISRSDAGLNIRNLQAETSNVSLNATLNGTAAGGNGQFNARLRDVGLFTDQLSGPVTASGTATRQGSTWGVDVTATGPGGIGATVDGTANDNGTLNLRVNGNAPLGLANPIIRPRRLSGNATFALGINGQPQLSAVTGQISVAGARLAAPTLGQSIENINATIGLTGNQANVNVTGNVERGGQIAIRGPVGLAAPNTADIGVTLSNVILKDPTLYESSIGGTISIRGPLAGGARIAGDLTLGPTEIQVPSSSLSSLGELPNVVHFGESAAVRQTLNRANVNANAGAAAPQRGSSGPTYPLDVTINAPSRIFIRGRGLDAELGGSLNLGGSTANIVPVGQFNLVRGRIDILQQRFELTEGSASLQGDFEAYIRLVAATETATGTVVNIIVEGPASAPEVTFSSVPELPQDEVLAQLIFGRNLSEISPLQAVQLAAAVSTLAGSGGGGLIDDFRQSIGLDDFDVTTDDEGNAAVRAGAYISENVYTDVTVSSDGSTEVNINLDITDEITAKGTAAADGETSIGIFFERDY